METHDVVVIGAGLAGLRAATRLAEAGRDVVVLEAGDAVGGRERTDSVDGFLLDRGFHVLNPAYPAVRRWVDIDALGMQPFPVGVRVRRERTVAELHHPLRHPRQLPATLRSGLVSAHDLFALARWILPALLGPRTVIDRPDRTLREGWNRAGLYGSLRTEVLQPFLAGVLAERDGRASDAFARLLVRMFVIGRPGLPAHGIGALPAQLAEHARAAGADIRLSHRVMRIASGTVDLDGGDPLRARDIVVAVDPDAAAALTGIPAPVTRGLQTWWFAVDGEVPASALLSVDGRRGAGSIVNTVVMSHSAPTYAPAGRHLVQATCLLPGTQTEREVRRQLAEIWRADVDRWQLIRRDDIPRALPAQPAPLRLTRPARLAPHLFIAGDHRDTASIQGALVSGDRAAGAVLAG